MIVGVYFSGSKVRKNSLLYYFVVETFLLVASQNPAHSFVFITTDELSSKSDIPSNVEVINLKELPGIFSKLGQGARLQRILKRMGVNLFVSVNNHSLRTTSIPRSLISLDVKNTKQQRLKKLSFVIVFNKGEKESLINGHGIPEEKISIVYPGAGGNFEPIEPNEKQEIQSRYSNGTEFFLYNSNFDADEQLVDLLKSFSLFKKRQQSSFKLLITGTSSPRIENRMLDYKYRHDVKFTGDRNLKITAAAYAVVLPFNTNDDMLAALQAMRSGVPVIVPGNSIVNEISGSAILQSETNSIRDIADKMMQIYTDENYRSILIQNGKAIAGKYTQEKTAGDLWQAILKALP